MTAALKRFAPVTRPRSPMTPKLNAADRALQPSGSRARGSPRGRRAPCVDRVKTRYARVQMASHADEATAWLSDKARTMAEAIAPLVEINSYTENPEGGRKVGALLRSLFAGVGLETLVRPSERFADHL